MTPRPPSPAVTHEVPLHCEDELGRPMTFFSSFAYHPDDPYAVWLTFHIPSGDVPWVLGRSLLLSGLTEPAGDGDIRLWPSVDDDGHSTVVMDFHSPEGRLVVEARSDVVASFLERTWDVVPAGTEANRVDLDLLVEALLT